MAYLHCRMQYGQMAVINTFNTVETPSSIIDFVTGDVTLGYTGTFRDYSGFTDGTTVTADEIANATVIDVGSTTNYSADDTIAIELDIGTFHKDRIVSVDSGTQFTIATGISSSASIGNVVVNFAELENSTSGTTTQDFKTPKVDTIFTRSKHLEITGFSHNNRNFFLTVNRDGDDDPRFTDDLLRLTDERLSGTTMSTEATLDYDLVPYSFVDNTDFDDWRDAQRARVLVIYGGGTGESGLVSDVTEAANTQAAMDAIVDTRT